MNELKHITASIEGYNIILKVNNDCTGIIHELNNNSSKRIDRVTLLSAVTSHLRRITADPADKKDIIIIDGDFNISIILTVVTNSSCINCSINQIIRNDNVWCTLGARTTSIDKLITQN